LIVMKNTWFNSECGIRNSELKGLRRNYKTKPPMNWN
jgi:hypothetical protein